MNYYGAYNSESEILRTKKMPGSKILHICISFRRRIFSSNCLSKIEIFGEKNDQTLPSTTCCGKMRLLSFLPKKFNS